MLSFGKIRDLLLLSHGSNFILEEFLVLQQEYQPVNLNPQIPVTFHCEQRQQNFHAPKMNKITGLT